MDSVPPPASAQRVAISTTEPAELPRQLQESRITADKQCGGGAEALLRHVVNCTPVVLWSVDAQGIFTLSEGRGLAALGLQPGQVVGQSAFEFYKDVPQIVAALRRGLSGADFTHSVELNGRTFETRTFHVSDAEGRSSGLVALSLDITERQQAEAERMKLQAKLLEVQRLESLGLMAGGIAHDFNNLLMVILGNASTALLSMPEGSDAHTDLEHVIAAAQRGAELTRKMLAFSGRGRFEARALDLSAQVRDLARMLGSTVSSKIQLHLDLAPEVTVCADPADMQQVIMNLVINAAESIGDESGTVRVQTGAQQLDEAEAKNVFAAEGLPPGLYAFVEVQDTGSGMDAATLAKIFDPFFTTKFTGRGLGLAAVLGIVRAHQGAIRVRSALSQGSTFRVLLPSSAEHVQSETRLREGQRGRGLVLVIDDDHEVRMTVRKMLATCGFSVIEAADGRLGVRDFEAHEREIGLVLLDMTMPELDGQETLRTIRQRSSVPVIMMSGFSEIEAMGRCASDPPVGFLQKPFSAEQMLEKLNQALGREVML